MRGCFHGSTLSATQHSVARLGHGTASPLLSVIGLSYSSGQFWHLKSTPTHPTKSRCILPTLYDLNAFVNYNVEFYDNDLENIAWRFKHKIYQVLIDPNQFKRVDIAIIIVGEAIGMVYLDNDISLKGIGRILVKIYIKNNNKVVAEILSESDGYIDYLGLEPGEYIAKVDTVQLNNLGYTADPPQRNFTIKTSREGDIAGGIDFVLQTEAKQQ